MNKKISIVQLNDTHAFMETHPELFYEESGIVIQQAGGYARIKTILDRIKKERPTLVLDNGDTFHGTYEVVQEKGWNMVPVVNAMGLHAMTFHWDIGYGPKNLKELGKHLNYPILAINSYIKDTKELYFDPYTLIEMDGLLIGVIGIAATIIDKTMPPEFSEGLSFTSGEKELPGYIQELKDKKADIIIVLSHLGFPQDVELMKNVKGVDICLSGHTHNRLERPVRIGETTIIQSGSQSSFIGRLDLEVIEGNLSSVNHSLIPITPEISENHEIKELVTRAVAPYKEKLSEVVGTTDGILHRGWGTECTMDNLLLEAILHHTKTDLVFSNGWRYGAPIDKGEITLKQLYQMIPMDPPLSTVEMTGAEVLSMLEENLENTYSRNPFDQMGGYVKRSLGLNVFFKAENPNNNRIQKLLINGNKINLEKTYTISYVTNQGVPKKYGTNHKNLDMHAIEALKNFLKENNPYYTQLFGTFTLI